jgi:hypothetical protein
MYNEPPFPIGFKKPTINLPPEKTRNRFGRMVYEGKVGGAIEIHTARSWKENKKYFIANGARSAVKNFSKSCCS